MDESLFSIMSTMKLTEGANEKEISNLLLSINFDPPSEYIQFLKYSNGAKGMLGKNFLVIWRANEVLSINKRYEVELFAPGLFLFGTDGGNEGYGFDHRAKDITIVKIPFIGLGWNDAIIICRNFIEFMCKLKSE